MTRSGSQSECPESRSSTPSRDEAPALLELVRLLARQAAREWPEAAQSADLPQTVEPRNERGQAVPPRRRDLALTGMSLRTVPSTKVRGARIVATTDLEAALSASPAAIQEVSDDEEEYDEESELW